MFSSTVALIWPPPRLCPIDPPVVRRVKVATSAAMATEFVDKSRFATVGFTKVVTIIPQIALILEEKPHKK